MLFPGRFSDSHELSELGRIHYIMLLKFLFYFWYFIDKDILIGLYRKLYQIPFLGNITININCKLLTGLFY